MTITYARNEIANVGREVCPSCNGQGWIDPQQSAATAEAQSEGEMREIQGLVRCAKCRWYHADWHVSCVNCGELLRAQVNADTGDLSEDEMGQTDGRELCAECRGSGVVKIKHGIKVCPSCNGHCWACPEPATSQPPAAVEAADTIARLTRERDEARAKLAAREQQAMRERWQPIKTAPKDGTPVLGFMPSYHQGLGGQSVVVWMEDEWYDMRAFATTPSHWMPLPAAPTTREEQ